MKQQDDEACKITTVPTSILENEQQQQEQGQKDPNALDGDCDMAPESSIVPFNTAMAMTSSHGDNKDPRQNPWCFPKCRKKFHDSFSRRRPRLFAVTCGFIFPLLSLVALAAICGFPLAMLETPLEVEQNDEVMVLQTRLLVQSSLYRNFTQNIPQICVKLILANRTAEDFLGKVAWIFDQHQDLVESIETTNSDEAAEESDASAQAREDSVEIFDNMWDYLFLPSIEEPAEQEGSFNTSELARSVSECGDELQPLIDKMLFTLMATASKALSSGLTFAWTRCPANETTLQLPDSIPASSLLDYVLFRRPNLVNTTSFSFEAQSAYYRQAWEQDRARIFDYYYDSGLGPKMNDTVRRIWAYEKSLNEATGSTDCYPNVPAACWFWFTVMTTIGYGNNSPASLGGKIMVCTLGFLAIILFGGVSARAAFVITSLSDDLLIRTNLRRWVSPWTDVVCWALAFSLYLVPLGAYYIQWQSRRLGPFAVTGLSEGYWFAFISITTVGFGDYYLAPEVIRDFDCVVYPTLFLLGFSLLAALLSKISVVIKLPLVEEESLVQHFQAGDNLRAEELRAEELSRQASGDRDAIASMDDKDDEEDHKMST